MSLQGAQTERWSAAILFLEMGPSASVFQKSINPVRSSPAGDEMKRTTCLLFGLCVAAFGVTGSLAVAGEADKNAEQEVYRLLLALPTGYEIKPENMATLARLEALGDQITPHLRTALL